MLKAMMQRLDKNGDGVLSSDEIPQPLKERLSKADSNGDGNLAASELQAAMANRQGQGRRGPLLVRRAFGPFVDRGASLDQLPGGRPLRAVESGP